MVAIRLYASYPQGKHQFKSPHKVFRRDVSDKRVIERRLGQGNPLGVKFHQYPLDADAETNSRKGRSIQLLHQTIIASAAAEGEALALAVHNDLKYRFGIVIKPANDQRIDLIADLRRVQQALQPFKMLCALTAQRIQDNRRVFHHALAARFLAVKHAQRVPVKAFPAVIAELIHLTGQIFPQPLMIHGAALRAADGVNINCQVVKSQFRQHVEQA